MFSLWLKLRSIIDTAIYDFISTPLLLNSVGINVNVLNILIHYCKYENLILMGLFCLFFVCFFELLKLYVRLFSLHLHCW
jgi:hypothetical protein